jgi:hypothetical protein
MNSNLFHNILNILIAAISLLTAVMLATGCTTLASGVLECSQSVVDPTYTALAIAVMGILKSVINIARDGLAGLVKVQPPVVDRALVEQLTIANERIDRSGT